MPLSPEEVGRRIREARLAKHWTHEELAAQMGVNWRTVHRWQSGRLPRVEVLMRLAEVLDLPQAYFVEPRDEATTLADLRARLDDLNARVNALALTVEQLAESLR